MGGTIDPETTKAIQRAQELFEQRKQIMKLSPENAMDTILSSRQPAALVHSFPEEDFHFLVADIGPEDSLPLLALASQKQWEYILDMEIWCRDRISAPDMARWLDLLLGADAKRFVRWFLEEQTDLVEFYLNKNLEIVFREHDQDPSDFGDDFFTQDDVFYVRVKDPPLGEMDEEAANLQSEIRHRFLETFLERLAKYDFVDYQKTILETVGVIPAEIEEEAFRTRCVRLAEKGFLPFDEAVGIYQPMTPEEIERKKHLFSRGVGDPSEMSLYRLRSPVSPLDLIDAAQDFSFSLKKFSIQEILPMVESEFASLCNRLASADQKAVRSRDQLKEVVEKALGYLSVGLDRLVETSGETTSGRMAALIERYPLEWIFRAGYGRALELKWRAEKWHKESWFAERGLPLTFWDEHWMGVLGGLLIKKPLFFDNYETGVIYREFRSTEDIEKTSSILENIVAADRLLGALKIEHLFLAPGRLLTYKNLLLTLWVKDSLGMEESPAVVPLKKFKPFFDGLFERKTDGNFETPAPIPTEIRASFLSWILRRSGMELGQIGEETARVFQDLFEEIESEYGMVSAKNLDPRFVNLFLLE